MSGRKQPNPWPPERGRPSAPPPPPPLPPRRSAANTERAARRLYAERLADALIEAAVEQHYSRDLRIDAFNREGARLRYSSARARAIALLEAGEVTC